MKWLKEIWNSIKYRKDDGFEWYMKNEYKIRDQATIEHRARNIVG